MRFTFPESCARVASLLCFIGGVLTLTIVPEQVGAYDWNSRYGIDAQLGYDDNYRLSNTDEVETTTSTLGVNANLQGTSEISTLDLSLGANATEYSDSTIDDSDGYRLSLATSRRGERLTSSLGISFESESTAETELLDTGVTEDGTRESLAITPAVTYSIDELNALSISLQHRDVSYDTVSLIDYVDNSVTLGWSRQLDESSGVSANLSMARYEPDDADETDTESIYFGYNWRTSQATGYRLSLGYSDVDRPNARDSGGNFSFAIDHETDERNSFVFSINQGFQPSGRGEVIEETSLAMRWTRALTDRSSFNLGATAVSNDNRDYYSINTGVGHQITQEINLGGSLRYRSESTDAGSPDSTSVFFSVAYRPL